MLKKKHSQINIQVTNLNYSPFRATRKSPFTRTPDRANLSPMKICRPQAASTKSPRRYKMAANFQSQLECLGETFLISELDSTGRQNNKGVFRGYDGATFSNISNYQTTERNMKESKKIFSNAISKMNSDKKKSNQNSIFEDSRQFRQGIYCHQQVLPIASFKALKQIKMIQSVQPLGPPPQLQKASSKKIGNHINKPLNFLQEAKVTQFEGDESEKKQKIIELINQSFSMNTTKVQKAFEDIQIKEDLILGKTAKILQSLQVDQSYDFKTLNRLLDKINVKSEGLQSKMQAVQSVKVSIENTNQSLTMKAFL